MHKFPEGAIAPLFRLRTRGHQRQVIEGSSKGHGSRSSYSEVYPARFCRFLARFLNKFFQRNISLCIVAKQFDASLCFQVRVHLGLTIREEVQLNHEDEPTVLGGTTAVHAGKRTSSRHDARGLQHTINFVGLSKAVETTCVIAAPDG